jgi:hypothetical protein
MERPDPRDCEFSNFGVGNCWQCQLPEPQNYCWAQDILCPMGKPPRWMENQRPLYDVLRTLIWLTAEKGTDVSG